MRANTTIALCFFIVSGCTSAHEAVPVPEAPPVLDPGGQWHPGPTLLDDAAYERIEGIPSYGDIAFEYPSMEGAAYGSAILTVGEQIKIVLVGRRPHGGADIWAEIPLDEGAAAALVGGGSIEFAGSETAPPVRVVEGDRSVAHALNRAIVSVDSRGLLAITLDLRDGQELRAEGRLVGACEHIDENSALRHVVETADDPACDYLVGWL